MEGFATRRLRVCLGALRWGFGIRLGAKSRPARSTAAAWANLVTPLRGLRSFFSVNPGRRPEYRPCPGLACGRHFVAREGESVFTVLHRATDHSARRLDDRGWLE